MEQFQDRLARLAELLPEELDALEVEVTAAFDAADAAADLESMQALADALDEIRRVKAEAEQPVEEAVAPVPAAAADPVPVAASADEPENTEPASEPTPDPEPEPTPDPEPAVEAEPEVEEPEVPETPEAPEPDDVPTTGAPEVEEPADEKNDTPAEADDEAEASSNDENKEPEVEITAADVPEEAQPVQADAAPITIRAGGDIPGITAGAVLSNMDDVVDALTKKINSMRGVQGDGEHLIVASARTEVEMTENRILRAGDMNGNSKKIREFLGDKDQLNPDGLVAGGWCAPRTPIYDVPTMGTTGRPVRDSLPSFNADRGGITWAQPPTLPQADFGVGIWRYQNDEWGSFTNPQGAGAAGTTKPCYTIVCGSEQSIDVDALTLCLCFNNMMVRAFPEWVRGNTDLVMVAQARFAEQVALSQMFAVASTGTCGSVVENVGAARDFVNTVRIAAAQKRWALRLGPDAPLQLLAPSWVAEAIAIDLGMQAPGDNTFQTSNSEVNGYFREFNVDPIWFIDNAPLQAAFTACNGFPAQAHWLLFPTGTFLRLDSGELNLGVVRTKEDIQKNSYCEFSETFETVAYMGPADKSWVVRGLTNIKILGGTGAPIDLTS